MVLVVGSFGTVNHHWNWFKSSLERITLVGAAFFFLTPLLTNWSPILSSSPTLISASGNSHFPLSVFGRILKFFHPVWSTDATSWYTFSTNSLHFYRRVIKFTSVCCICASHQLEVCLFFLSLELLFPLNVIARPFSRQPWPLNFTLRGSRGEKPGEEVRVWNDGSDEMTMCNYSQ